MRSTSLVLVTATAILAWPAPALAQMKEPIKIDRVRVGFPSTPSPGDGGGEVVESPVYKAGAWTPVYVDISVGMTGLGLTESERAYKFEVVVETNDSDGIANNYIVPLPVLEPKQAVTVPAYTRTGSSNSENITVSIRQRKSDDDSGRNICPSVKSTVPPLEPSEVVYLTIGSRLQGLRRSLRTANPKANYAVQEHLAYLDSVEQMPEHWWGYEGVDLVILNTSDRSFVNDGLLNRDPENRRKRALADWVRHGGRLVVAAGRNQDLVGQLPELNVVLPVTPKGTMQFDEIRPRWSETLLDTLRPSAKLDPAGKPIPLEVARLQRKPGRAVEVLMRAEQTNAKDGNDEYLKGGQPLAVRGSHGMGQVIVFAFDLDQPPFSTWAGQGPFWHDRFLSTLGPRLPPDNQGQRNVGRSGLFRDDSSDVILQLQNHLENFEEVPVISFGWVALFILIYIIVVGPLDYFILKKVVKRLELTWITFPVVVLSVSAIAYFTAYWLKGNDLRINKVDVVDIDLQTQQAYGSTWFTVFSPRIQHYTIGVEPAAPEWTKASDDGKPAAAMVTWLGRPEPGWRGGGRARGQSLFRRAYDYEERATGLKGVPIQVWSTKSFTASWHAPVDVARPLLEVEGGALTISTERAGHLKGTILWNGARGNKDAAIELKDAVLIWNDSVYKVGGLVPGAKLTVQQLFAKDSQANPQFPGGLSTVLGSTTPSSTSINRIMQAALFDDPSSRTGTLGNTSLRYLDETWRGKRLKEEAVLFGRLAPVQGQAEDVTKGPASVTRLWLGRLPSSGETRPSLAGTLRQDTYVRVFIPVRR